MNIKSVIRQYIVRRFQVPQIPTALENLASVGFYPEQVFDVGAYKGEFAECCLKIWANTKVACFEALESKVSQLEKMALHNSAIQVFPGLLGAQECDKVPLYEAETASSVLIENHVQDFPVTFHKMRTVDKIVQENFGGKSPDLLKIDIQGYELEVLKGAEKSLSGMQVILLELNLLDVHQNVPLFAEVIKWLDERGWVAYDVCGLTRRPLDNALWQADLIFVLENSPLRSDKRWGI